MRILVADDHAVVRRGLREILEESFADVTIGEADNADAVFAAVATQDWNLLLLDLSLRGSDGLAVLADLVARHPALPVLVISMHAEETYGPRVLKAGAAGYVSKESAPEHLVEAVRKTAAGGRYVSAALAETLARAFAGDERTATPEALSVREFDVLRRLAGGTSVKRIALDLDLSAKTISTYRSRLLEKLRLRSTAELIRYAMDHGIGG